MPDQLTYFEQYIARVTRLVGKKKTDQLLSKGLAIVVAGSNDLAITYYGQGAQWIKDDIHYFTSKIANSAASFVMVSTSHVLPPSYFFYFQIKNF